MIRRIVPHVTMLALLAGLAAVSWQAMRVLDRPVSATTVKTAAADRVLAYRITKERGGRFLLDGGRMRLRLSSLLVIPEPATFDPSLAFTYRFSLVVTNGDRELFRSEVAVVSRQSKRGWNGIQWEQESAWADGVQLTDERITMIDLPTVPVDSILEIRLAGEGEAVLRASVAEARDADARDRIARRWEEENRSDLLRSSTYVPWPLLQPMEKEHRARRRWLRMSALGEHGVDFTTRTVFVSDFRTPALTGDAEGIEVSRERAAVVNVLGPVKLSVEPVGNPMSFRVETIGTAPQAWASSGKPLEIEVAAGPTSVVVIGNTEKPARFRIFGEHERWITADQRRAAAPRDQIVPTRVRIPMIVVGPTATAIVPNHQLSDAGAFGRILRVDARVMRSPGQATFETPTITVKFRARNGVETARYEVPVEGIDALFDRLEWNGVNGPISEPYTFRVIAPLDVAHVELAADRDVAITLQRWLPGEIEREQPYTEQPRGDLTWRYAPLVRRSWFPLSPGNFEELALARRVAQLEAQVRIDATDPARRYAAGVRTTPPGRAPRYEVIPLWTTLRQRARELVGDDDLAELIRTWPAGAFTELRPQISRMIDFRAKLRSRPRLSWVVPAANVGTSVTVWLDSTPIKLTLATASGSAELPGVPPGSHRVRVEAIAAAQLWISRPPVGERRDVYRDRTLYSLDRGPLAASVYKRAGEQIHVYALFYTSTNEPAPKVRLTVDRGRPQIKAGVVKNLTTSELVTALPPPRGAAARLVDLGGRSAGAPRVVHLGLLDDLAPGQHRIEVTSLSGPGLWIRLIATRRASGEATMRPVPVEGAREASDDE